MRLLNVYTLKLEEFVGYDIPDYCILSHQWAREEVSYKEFRKGLNQNSAGYRKIVDYCAFVRNRKGYFEAPKGPGPSYEPTYNTKPCEWVWIDTCCIDKRSSSELSEAINSMYAWYERACECHVYLWHFPKGPDSTINWDNFSRSLGRCSWFTRGGTLQELLAPQLVVFCNTAFQVIGNVQKERLADLFSYGFDVDSYGPNISALISAITGIPEVYLRGTKTLDMASIAQRMSWAADRTTTRVEDIAYCLLGMFGINMPLMYGEETRACTRLQEEIVKRSNDQSILTWDRVSVECYGEVLAPSPSHFGVRDDDNERCHLFRQPFAITNNGLEIRAKLYTALLPLKYPKKDHAHEKNRVYRLLLNYSTKTNEPKYLNLVKNKKLDVYERPHALWRSKVSYKGISEDSWQPMEEKTIYLKLGSEIVRQEK